MSAPFWREVGIAVLLSGAGAVAFAAASPLLGSTTSLRGVALLLSAGYLGWLLHALQARSGRLLCIAGWLAVMLALSVFAAPTWAWCALPLLLLWLVRSLYRYPPLYGAALDALLTLLALAAAVVTARHSGSLLLALWCLFLLQALHVFIPARTTPAAPDATRFDRAYATADATLQRLAGGR